LLKCTEIAGKKILEVGAGTGRDSIKMAQAGAFVCTLDYSSESLRLVRSDPRGHLTNLVMANALECPFPDGTFDIVFHQGLLEHFASPHHLLIENRRVLKKNGLLVIDVPQTFHVYTVMKHVLMMLGRWFAGWERQFTPGSLRQLVAGHGFEAVHQYGAWSQPGIFYKVIRETAKKFNRDLPMYPRPCCSLSRAWLDLQPQLRHKRLFQYTELSIGIIARKK
jgi:ubiquinone/menaquinone biosynthesis C-methylase UbiE